MLGYSGDHYAQGPRGFLFNPHFIHQLWTSRNLFLQGTWFHLGPLLNLDISAGSWDAASLA